ncbi:hypothetical protein E6O75_ATG07303 [Venturia nashicola]|uniref:Uncharacterized protein n=1 Tax=Venturia nashicola TaxID=86259 RepID=A0A4Z1NMT4_9PEZI|nr:hypothetical protein E6O75_ATG07303 [Venturia nashicola]
MPYEFGRRWPWEKCCCCGKEGFQSHIVHERNCFAGYTRIFDKRNHPRGEEMASTYSQRMSQAWNEHDLRAYAYFDRVLDFSRLIGVTSSRLLVVGDFAFGEDAEDLVLRRQKGWGMRKTYRRAGGSASNADSIESDAATGGDGLCYSIDVPETVLGEGGGEEGAGDEFETHFV